MLSGGKLPPHVKAVAAPGIEHVKLIDSTPIGINVRSTVATYAGIHDELRKIYGRSKAAKAAGFKAGDFSYNTGKLRCPVCDGTGEISLDVQFLPDVDIPCPGCRGSRYSKAAESIRVANKEGVEKSLPELMAMDVTEALTFCRDMKNGSARGLKCFRSLARLPDARRRDPGLSGGEAQRLKLRERNGAHAGRLGFRV